MGHMASLSLHVISFWQSSVSSPEVYCAETAVSTIWFLALEGTGHDLSCSGLKAPASKPSGHWGLHGDRNMMLKG